MSSTLHPRSGKKLGIELDTLAHYIAAGKVPAPETRCRPWDGVSFTLWTDAEIEHVRQLLPKIANGQENEGIQKSCDKYKSRPAGAPRSKKKKTTEKEEVTTTTNRPKDSAKGLNFSA